MEDISNKTLAVLVVIAIVISCVALFVVVGKFRIIKTGMATESTTGGNITLNVAVDVDILATDSLINFGAMYPEQWNNSEEYVNYTPPYNSIKVQNVGATTVNIDYWANQSMFDKLNGTVNIDNLADGVNTDCNYVDTNVGCTDEAYKIKILNDGTCATTIVSTTDYENVLVNESVSGANPLIEECSQNDEFEIGIHVHVPQFEESGAKISTLNFRATEY